MEALGIGIGFGTSVLGVCGVVIAAILQRSKRSNGSNSVVLAKLSKIENDLANGHGCQAGKSEQCINHERSIGEIKRDIKHVVKKVDHLCNIVQS